jgi:hypothetical protein
VLIQSVSSDVVSASIGLQSARLRRRVRAAWSRWSSSPDAVEDRQDLLGARRRPVKRGRESTRRGEPQGDDGLPGRRALGVDRAVLLLGRLSNEEGNSM